MNIQKIVFTSKNLFTIFAPFLLYVKEYKNITKMAKEQEPTIFESVYPRYILGLDVSTACIGVCVLKDDGGEKPEILYLSHKTPKIPRKIKGIEALFLRKQIFEDEFVKEISSAFPITDVVIEEPLISSNNANTVATLLRFNGMIAECVYRILGIVPNFISSYDARTYSFPQLVSIRKFNKKGEEYPLKHIKSALKNDNIVLFGSYPFDVDKKMVMMNMVNEMYGDGNINWVYNAKGELKKENYDACDSLVCALAYININHHGIEIPSILTYDIEKNNNKYNISYITKIWDREYKKTLTVTEE